MDCLKFKLEVVEGLSAFPHTNKSILTDYEDSKSALEAFCKGDTKLTQDINILLRQINKPSILQWIPAHVSIGVMNVPTSLLRRIRLGSDHFHLGECKRNL
ncbi:hypothetical protein TNCV_582371 [Trichonephila clavipes]|nr:hypothetical protein TNCV_582371 [Trichonephila clavipes]